MELMYDKSDIVTGHEMFYTLVEQGPHSTVGLEDEEADSILRAAQSRA